MIELTNEELLGEINANKAALAQKSFFHFFRDYAWPVLQPSTPMADNWHIHAICEHLEAVTLGHIKRLLINMPFRMLKSTIISQSWPAWEWTNKPHIQYLTASYAKDVATRDAVDSRRIIESAMYQAAWGRAFRMTSDQNVKTRYENSKKGSRVVTATDAAGTGFGGNRIVVDDPISALEADSEVALANSIEWWKGTASTRLNNPEEDAIVVVGQRLAQGDLSGYILENEAGLGWEHLMLPMRYDKELRKTTSLGFVDPRKKEGEVLSPNRVSDKTVVEMETRLGAYHTAAQLQQNPTSREGTIFKKAHWKFFNLKPELMVKSMDEIIWTWDLTFKDLATSDFVAGLCLGYRGADVFLLARDTERRNFASTKSAILNNRALQPFASKCIATLVEDKANGPAIIESLTGSVPGLIPVSPSGGKTARAYACQPEHEAGNFYLPSPTLPGYEWVTAFVELFAKFPGVKNDDDVDAFTQGVNWRRTREGYKPQSPKPATGGGRYIS